MGFNIQQTDTAVMLDQNDYITNLITETVSASRSSQKTDSLTPEEYTQFRSLVGRLNWAVQGTRPDLAFELIDMSTRLKNATINNLLRALKGIKKLKAASSVISSPYLGQPSSWKIILFSDASHANLCNGTGSMGGHILFLVGLNRKCRGRINENNSDRESLDVVCQANVA